MNTNPTHKQHVAPWWVAAMLAATASLPGCAGSEPQSAPPQRATAEATLETARQSAESGDADAALTKYEEAIALNPKLPDGYIGSAGIYQARGDYASAERRYGQAADIAPNNFEAQYNHGLMLQMLGRYGESVRAYLRAIPLKPDDFNACLNCATAYLQLGEPKQAALFAQRAVKLDPNSAPAHVNLAEINRSLGQHDQAVAEYQQAAAIALLSPESLVNLADSLGVLGRYAEMEDAAARVVQFQPSARAYERLGTAQFRQGKNDDALASFQKSLDIDADYYPALNSVGVCQLNKYLTSGKTDHAALDAAVAAFRRSLQIEHSQPRVTELLARWG